MRKGRRVKKEIEKKMLVLKQLEGVYRTSTDSAQKKRVLKEIKDVKKSIKSLKTILSLQNQYGFEQPEVETDVKVGFSILSSIKVSQHSEDVKDIEMDAVVSYTGFFEQNYLPILSEYYLKLDYNNALKRDTFYPRYMEIKRLLKEYNYELEIQSKEEYYSIALYKDKSIVHKMRQRYLLRVDRYFKELRAFVKLLVDDQMAGGNIVLNPLDTITLSEYEEERRLDGYMVSDALIEMCTFFEEFIRFLNMPSL